MKRIAARETKITSFGGRRGASHLADISIFGSISNDPFPRVLGYLSQKFVAEVESVVSTRVSFVPRLFCVPAYGNRGGPVRIQPLSNLRGKNTVVSYRVRA